MSENDFESIVNVALGERRYDIVIGDRTLAGLGGHVSKLVRRPRAFVLSDETVFSLHGKALQAALERAGINAITKTVPAGEQSKSFGTLEGVLNWLLDAGAERSDVIIAFGGGVIGDLGGLAASLMKRGMELVQVPTSLLAQVDSSVGGKTAVNTPHGKNLVGQFYQPRLVLADTALLATLDKRHLRAGYAEIVKYGLINDADFFEWLDANGAAVLALEPDAIAEAVTVSCRAKAAIVAEDEREGGVRALLNLGHTFGHALEAVNNFGPELLHGEAVAIGMVLALKYSAAQGLMASKEALRVRQHLSDRGLAVDVAALAGGPYMPGPIVEVMAHDKKARGGAVPLILSRGIGQAFIQPDVDMDNVRQFLEQEIS